ncbi:hypothetical protein CFP56_016184 [Quercus suber]|uniref:Uncharacterized protein n=1 Tax=Quercus suber TaxID=58331 RepID=A0AAW0KQB5_QUESU
MADRLDLKWYCPNQLTSFPLFPYLERLSLSKCSLKQSLERMMINNKTLGNLHQSLLLLLLQFWMTIEEALQRSAYQISFSPYSISRQLSSSSRHSISYGTSTSVCWNSKWLIYSMIGMRWNGKDLRPFSLCISINSEVGLSPNGLQYVSSLQNLQFAVS